MLNLKKNKYLYLSIILFSIYALVVYYNKEESLNIEYDNNNEDGNSIINQDLDLNIDDSITIHEVQTIKNKNITNSGVEKININNKEIEQKVIKVGLNKKGEIFVPNNPNDIAWYEQVGKDTMNILLAGHRTWGSKKGIFYKSEFWEKGLTVELTFDNGETEIFELKEKYIYRPELTPEAIMNTSKGKYRLTLITCSLDGEERVYNVFYLKSK